MDLNAYRRQCEGLEGDALHARFRASFHGPFECPQLSRKSRLRLQTFLFFFFFFLSKGAFPFLSYCYVTVDREPPQETIPFSSTRMRSSPSTDYLNGRRKATERKGKNKNQSSPSTSGSTTLPFDEVTPSSVHTRTYTYTCAHETGGLGKGEQKRREPTLLDSKPRLGQVCSIQPRIPAIVARRFLRCPLAQDANNDVTMAAVSALQKQRPLCARRGARTTGFSLSLM